MSAIRAAAGGADGLEGLPWEGPAIGLLDLDAFFASVEQLDHPEWRGKPVIVGGDAERRGVVSTASYEARRYGVHSAMPAAQAARLCPDAIWTHGHFDRYREMSALVMGVLGDETPLVEQVSIDEAFFDVTPGRFSRESPVTIARRVQGRVARLGVTCSIGIGTSKTVAKIASEAEKPRGLTVVLPGSEATFLAPLPVRAMSGVGAATEGRLASLGIRTLGALAKADPRSLERVLGVAGPRLIERAAGLEHSAVAERAAEQEVKSVSNERTFARDLSTPAEVEAALAHVCSLVGRRLRRKGLAGRCVTVRVKFDATRSRTAQRQLGRTTDDEGRFGPVAIELLRQIWTAGTPVRLLGVGVSEFGADTSEQLGLFDDGTKDERAETLRRLHVAADAVQSRFGTASLAHGRDLRLRDATTNTAPLNKDSD